MRQPRVAIITAVASELAAVRELLDLGDYTDPGDGSVYMRGVLASKTPRENCADNWEVILPMPASAGNVISGITTNRVANSVRPDIVMFIGCAGGIPGKIGLYDVVVADRIFYYEPGKADVDFFPRPDLAKPSRKMLERAKAEIHFSRWLDYLHPNLPNESPNARVEPIAAGELLIKNSNSAYMDHVKLVAPRSVAVEQEGFGVLLAAQESGVEALVVRGISDLLDDKGSDAIEDLAAFNPRQIKAARHAAAFAFSVLANLDISWLPDVAFVGADRVTRMLVELEGNLAGIKKVEYGLQQWLRDGSLTGLKCTHGSIKAEFSVDAGHATLLKSAIDAGLITDIEGHVVTAADVAAPSNAQLTTEISQVIQQIDLDQGIQQPAMRRLRAFATEVPQFQHFLEVLVELVGKAIDSRRAERQPTADFVFNRRSEPGTSESAALNKGSSHAPYLDIDIDSEELSLFSKSRNFFIWPSPRHILGLLGWSQKQLYYTIDSSPSLYRYQQRLSASIVANALAGEPISYIKALQIVAAMEDISDQHSLKIAPSILASIFSLRNRHQLVDLPRSDKSKIAEQINIPEQILDEMAEGDVVTLNVADAVADALFSIGIINSSDVYIPMDRRRLRVASTMGILAVANRLRPAARPYINRSELRRF